MKEIARPMTKHAMQPCTRCATVRFGQHESAPGTPARSRALGARPRTPLRSLSRPIARSTVRRNDSIPVGCVFTAGSCPMAFSSMPFSFSF